MARYQLVGVLVAVQAYHVEAYRQGYVLEGNYNVNAYSYKRRSRPIHDKREQSNSNKKAISRSRREPLAVNAL